MTKYITKDGDTLDWICWKYYQQQAGAVEAVMLENPRLADHGPVFPAGIEIVLPEISTQTEESVTLW